MKILLTQKLYQKLGSTPPTTTTTITKDNPLLKEQLAQTQKDLDSILNKWKFGGQPLRTAEEFLKKLEPWINQQLKEQKDLKELLKRQTVKNLTELEAKINKGLTEEQQEKLNNYDNLETVLDQTKRDLKTAEQEVLALNNRFKNRGKELEKAQKDKEELEKKYKAKVKQLDTEQLENKKLEEQVEKLQTKIKELENERKELLVEIKQDEVLTSFETWLKSTKEWNDDWETTLKEMKKKESQFLFWWSQLKFWLIK